MTIHYDGALSGLSRTGALRMGDADTWTFEGRSYDTPATEDDVLETTAEALSEPSEPAVELARDLVFGKSGCTFTSQALTAMARAYEAEAADCDACSPVVALLLETARRVAVIEALTV